MYSYGASHHVLGQSIPHIRSTSLSVSQNTNTPDINLERDLIQPEVGLGIQATELSTDIRFQINLSTILMSALIFLAILAWFDFIQTTFYTWLTPETQEGTTPPSVTLWYALLITGIVMILVVLIYYHSSEHVK